EALPGSCVYMQKTAFEDSAGAVPPKVPVSTELDGQVLNWTDEERVILAEDPATVWLTEFIRGGIHSWPDGVESGKWIKLGWAFNDRPTDPHEADRRIIFFRISSYALQVGFNPPLQAYIGRLPRGGHHYGGYYTMTEENWPLIGPAKTPGSFVAGALSGFGTMAACSAGSICADWVVEGNSLPMPSRSRLRATRTKQPWRNWPLSKAA